MQYNLVLQVLKKGVVKVELNKELLKGHIDTLILAILEKNDSYGFEIAKNVLNKTTFELKDGTLYISLKRMESKGLIESYWQSSTGAYTIHQCLCPSADGILPVV